MFGAQSIGEAALAAPPYVISGGGAVIGDGVAEALTATDAAAVVLGVSLGLAETAALDGLMQAPGLPLGEQLDVGLGLGAQFLPTALWTEVPAGASNWTPFVAADVSWLALAPSTTNWINQ